MKGNLLPFVSQEHFLKFITFHIQTLYFHILKTKIKPEFITFVYTLIKGPTLPKKKKKIETSDFLLIYCEGRV